MSLDCWVAPCPANGAYVRHATQPASRSEMADPPSSERFKPPIRQIPGVIAPAARRSNSVSPTVRLAVGLLIVLLIVLAGARWALHAKRFENAQSGPAPQIVVPTPASELAPAMPHATEADPAIATASDLAKSWSFKNFFIRNRLTGEDVPALIVRLPGAAASQASGYWAFSLKAPFGRCQLEYVNDLDKLASEYGFRAKHPMVGNPCSRTVFDPLKLTNLPGSVWVRGAIVQGSDLRPPLGIEVEIRGKEILAIRME